MKGNNTQKKEKARTALHPFQGGVTLKLYINSSSLGLRSGPTDQEGSMGLQAQASARADTPPFRAGYPEGRGFKP
jgi:hypothetical protein